MQTKMGKDVLLFKEIQKIFILQQEENCKPLVHAASSASYDHVCVRPFILSAYYRFCSTMNNYSNLLIQIKVKILAMCATGTFPVLVGDTILVVL